MTDITQICVVELPAPTVPPCTTITDASRLHVGGLSHEKHTTNAFSRINNQHQAFGQ